MNDYEKQTIRASTISLISNAFLTSFKFIAGIVGNSEAMISDAIHSASDFFTTVLVIIGAKISQKKEDDDHQYGHERMEAIISVILACTLFVAAFEIGKTGVINSIYVINGGKLETPTFLPLIAAVVSIVVQESKFWYVRSVAKKINSSAMMADAWHARSDALSSIGSLIGIGGAMVGFPIMDPIASILICFMIFKVGIDILKNAVDQLVDKSIDNQTLEKVKNTIIETSGVIKIDDIKTRMFGNKAYVEVEICVGNDLSLVEAHNIAERVHDKIETDFIDIKHCMVHVNPESAC